ncbi:hypothetical protein P7C70_g4276, partial [Phenoliferia sp. Uapishka_3]
MSTTASRSRATSRAPSTRAPSTKPALDSSSIDNCSWVVALNDGRGSLSHRCGAPLIRSPRASLVFTLTCGDRRQYADSPSFVKTLHLFSTRPPAMILVPPSFLGGSLNSKYKEGVATGGDSTTSDEGSMLVRSLRDAWKDTPIVPVARKYWNEQIVKSKFYALTAVSALFKYLDSAHALIFPPRSLRINYTPLEGTCLIDTDTASNLELVSNLVGQLASAPRPPKLTSTSDPSKEAEQKINRALQLRTLLNTLPALRAALQGMDSDLIKTAGRILEDEKADEMCEAVDATINVDVAATLQKGSLAARNVRIYAVKSQRKKLLDVARETYKENVNDAIEMGEELSRKFGLNISSNLTGQGFVFSCAAVELEEKRLPAMFVHAVKKGKKMEFSSLDLKKKNARLQESVQEVYIMSNTVLDELFDEVRTGIASLFRIAEAIAMVDMLSADTYASDAASFQILAKLAKLPSDVLLRGSEVSRQLESLAEEGVKKAESSKLAWRRKELLQLTTTLLELVDARGGSADYFAELLKELQDSAINVLASTIPDPPRLLQSPAPDSEPSLEERHDVEGAVEKNENGPEKSQSQEASEASENLEEGVAIDANADEDLGSEVQERGSSSGSQVKGASGDEDETLEFDD